MGQMGFERDRPCAISRQEQQTSRSNDSMEKGIFDGLKVLDCASFIAAPAAATVLSDFGADVIKIEPPVTGDPYRNLPNLPGYPHSEHNFAWMLEARNKRSLALDLSKPEGQAVLHHLAAQADVFITNYPPQMRARLGITHEHLAPNNERLIYASFTGYGEKGEEANKPGFDSNAYWARSGLMDLVRADEHTTPARSIAGMGDQRFATKKDRHARSLELVKMFYGIFATKDLAEWRKILDGNGLVFGVVGILDDIPNDQQMIDNEVLVPFENDTMLTISSPIWVDGSRKVQPRKPPGLGEHSDEILRNAGYDEAAIGKLRASGAVA